MRELEEESLWDFPIQQWLQKSKFFLLTLERLQSLNTIFMASTLGWPSLKCQLAKETKLQDVVLTIESTTTILFEDTIGNSTTSSCIYN